ncbi:MAG TPA: histidine kinase [Microlunatus sp.]|jgi:signal transduction histidine kinase|nr:histidine kinase [Microlunatus sp.]
MSTSLPTTTLERIRRATPSRYDALIAVVAWLLDVSLFAQTLVAGPAAILYSILTGAVIAWRRSAPLAVFAIVCLCTLLGALAFPEYWPFAGLLVALYTVATSTRLAIALPALIAAFLLRAPLGVLQEWGDNPEDPKTPVGIAVAGLYAVIISGTWLLGRWSHRSRARIHELVQREQDVTEAVRAERRKLAHELHDIVSHSVSVMVLQARGARRVLDDDPPRADEALGNIERVGKQSMVELRRLLGVLEAPPAQDAATAATGGAPQPGLADLPILLEAMQLSGLTVRLVEQGAPASLDPSVDLSAYRIVQESLTNSVKYAGRDATATVSLSWSDDALGIEVVDNGGTADTTQDLPSTQHGLPGLRERARAVGGHLEAGPIPHQGFRVAATLPLAGSTHTPDQPT